MFRNRFLGTYDDIDIVQCIIIYINILAFINIKTIFVLLTGAKNSWARGGVFCTYKKEMPKMSIIMFKFFFINNLKIQSTVILLTVNEPLFVRILKKMHENEGISMYIYYILVS
jgi:hypothetical protein